MNRTEITRRKEQIEDKFGPWLIHDLQLQDGLRTIGSQLYSPPQHSAGKLLQHEDPSVLEMWEGAPPFSAHAKRVVQIISDISKKPIGSLRILDLACNEGGYAIELARHGSTVVGIEGREANLAKAKFAKEVLSLSNIEFILGDVRDISEQAYGSFDVILCLGILYHLNAPDVFQFVEKIAGMCDQFTVIDTELSLHPETPYVYTGRTYWGAVWKEHEATDTADEIEKDLWASLDNLNSFLFTRFSLINFLQHLGFSSVHECAVPLLPGRRGRTTFLAMRGQEVELLNATATDQAAQEYSEINSGRRDSEMHLLNIEIQNLRKELARLKSHPYVRLGM